MSRFTERWVPSLVRVAALTGVFSLIFLTLTPKLAKVPSPAAREPLTEDHIVTEEPRLEYPMDEREEGTPSGPVARPTPKPTPPPDPAPAPRPWIPEEVWGAFLAGLAVEISIQIPKSLYALATRKRK